MISQLLYKHPHSGCLSLPEILQSTGMLPFEGLCSELLKVPLLVGQLSLAELLGKFLRKNLRNSRARHLLHLHTFHSISTLCYTGCLKTEKNRGFSGQYLDLTLNAVFQITDGDKV
jgi:hypothetical protein